MALRDPTRAVQISAALKLILDEADVCIKSLKHCNFNKNHVPQLRKLQSVLTTQRIDVIEAQKNTDSNSEINTEIARLQSRIAQLQSQLSASP